MADPPPSRWHVPCLTSLGGRFVLPNLGDAGVAIRLRHGTVITWDGRKLRHGTGLPVGPAGVALAEAQPQDQIRANGFFMCRGSGGVP